MLANNVVPSAEAVKALICESEPATVPELGELNVDLKSYDALIAEAA
jgi:hypothetical protein